MSFARVLKQSYVNGGLGIKVETGNRVPGDLNEVVGVFNITGEVAVTLLTAQVVELTKDDGADIRVYHYNTPAAGTTHFSAAGSIAAIVAGSLLQFPDVTTDICIFVDALVPVTIAGDLYQMGFLGGFGIASLMNTGQIRYVIASGSGAGGLLKWYLYYIPISHDAEVTPAF